jgi:hypothetical protein
MPSYPSEILRRALREAGIQYADQDRMTLRDLLEERVGRAPPEHCNADELAEMLLALHEPPRFGMHAEGKPPSPS